MQTSTPAPQVPVTGHGDGRGSGRGDGRGDGRGPLAKPAAVAALPPTVPQSLPPKEQPTLLPSANTTSREAQPQLPPTVASSYPGSLGTTRLPPSATASPPQSQREMQSMPVSQPPAGHGNVQSSERLSEYVSSPPPPSSLSGERLQGQPQSMANAAATDQRTERSPIISNEPQSEPGIYCTCWLSSCSVNGVSISLSCYYDSRLACNYLTLCHSDAAHVFVSMVTAAEDNVCILCDSPADCQFVPCGHAVMCLGCGERTKKCPHCKVHTCSTLFENCG